MLRRVPPESATKSATEGATESAIESYIEAVSESDNDKMCGNDKCRSGTTSDN